MREEIYPKLKQLIAQQEFSLLEKECQLILLDNPNNTAVLQYLGLAYTNLNKIEQAEQVFLSIVKLQPSSLAAHLNLARFYKFKKNYELSFKYYSNCIELNKDDYALCNELAEFLISNSKLDEAEILLINTISKHKNKDVSYYNLGIIYLQKNSLVTALNFFNEAELINQENLSTKKYIFHILLKLERRTEIIERCLFLIKQKPHFIDSYIYLINAYVAKGDQINAKQYLIQAIAIKPNHPELVRLNVLLNKIDVVGDYVTNVISCFDNSSVITDKIVFGYALAKIFEDSEDYKQASTWIKKSNKLKEETYPHYRLEQHLDQFDVLVNFFKKHYQELKNKKSKLEKVPIFIVGMPRSGSTLVEQILSAHSKISSAGETSAFSEAVEKMIEAPDTTIFCDTIQKSSAHLFQDIGELYLKQLEINNANQGSFFTDKMLLNFKLLPLIKLCFPSSKIIHCTRNFKDVCTSILKTNFDGYLPWAYNEKSLVAFYKKYQKTMMEYNNILSNEIYEVSYEQLVNDHEHEINKLVTFCDLEVENSCHKFFENKRDVNTASILQVRRKIYTSSINYWKNFAPYFSEMYDSLEKI
jgi:tetratricopeptide (TPR) repeat protein